MESNKQQQQAASFVDAITATKSECEPARRSCEQQQQRRNQRESMISIRKDYSYKYSNGSAAGSSISSTSASSVSPTVQKEEVFLLPAPSLTPSIHNRLRRESTFVKRHNMTHHHPDNNAVKSSSISILERYDYDKSKLPFTDKFAKFDNNNFPVSESAISSSTRPSPVTVDETAAVKSRTPTTSPIAKKKKRTDGKSSSSSKKKKKEPAETSSSSSVKEAEQEVKVIVAQEIKTEPIDIKPASVPSSPQQQQQQSQPENINKINNKINIIFQLNNDNGKNIIWHHRRAQKKITMQKITIKEANNNTTKSEEERSLKLTSAETQTESVTSMNLSSSNPLVDEPVEFLFFEDDILVSLQRNTITFYEFNRLATMLRKGEPDFQAIDSIPRRLHDHPIDADNKFQRLCYNEQNPFPIYVEMRAKQKTLDDPEMMCPIAFSYCNVYYIDQERAKFSSVHLDTVKSTFDDIVYTCIPGTSYFIMAWNETSPETKSIVTGLVKYKLTPNLDLAKLASIRQFPKLNYRTKQVYCGQGEFGVASLICCNKSN